MFLDKNNKAKDESIDECKQVFSIVREYLEGKSERYKIKRQVVWILPQLISVLAYDAVTRKKVDAQEIEYSIKFILKYYAVSAYFPNLHEYIKNRNNDVTVLRGLMLVILGSVNSNISCEHLLSAIKFGNLKQFCEFNLFFDYDEEHFKKWQKIFTMKKEARPDPKIPGAKFFKKEFLQEIIKILHSLFSFFKCSEDFEKIKQAGFFIYVLSKCRDQFKFGNWIAIECPKGKSPVVIFREKEKSNGSTKKLKSPPNCCYIKTSYIKENVKFISDFSQMFFKPYQNKLYVYDFYYPQMLLIIYIKRCLTNLSNHAKRPPVFIQQWSDEFEKHRYDYYGKINQDKFGFRVYKDSPKSNEKLCEKICEYLKEGKGKVKEICEIVGIELASNYIVKPWSWKKKLPETLQQQLDESQPKDQIVPEYMPEYMKVCNELKNVIIYIKNIWRKSNLKNSKMMLVYAIACNNSVRIWKMSTDHEIEILKIATYSNTNKLEYKKCEYFSEKSIWKKKDKVTDILYKDGKFLLLEQKPFEPGNKKPKILKVQI